MVAEFVGMIGLWLVIMAVGAISGGLGCILGLIWPIAMLAVLVLHVMCIVKGGGVSSSRESASSPTGSEAPTIPRPHRRTLATAAAVLVVAIGVDLARSPSQQLTARAMIAAIHLYRRVGEVLVPGPSCRMRPPCSRYAETVIRDHGAVRGAWLALGRLIRCGPWTAPGTADPPPTRVSSTG